MEDPLHSCPELGAFSAKPSAAAAEAPAGGASCSAAATTDNLTFHLRHFTAKLAPEPLLQWCFDLVRAPKTHARAGMRWRGSPPPAAVRAGVWRADEGKACTHHAAQVKSSLYQLYLPVWGWSDADKRKQLAAVRGLQAAWPAGCGPASSAAS